MSGAVDTWHAMEIEIMLHTGFKYLYRQPPRYIPNAASNVGYIAIMPAVAA